METSGSDQSSASMQKSVQESSTPSLNLAVASVEPSICLETIQEADELDV